MLRSTLYNMCTLLDKLNVLSIHKHDIKSCVPTKRTLWQIIVKDIAPSQMTPYGHNPGLPYMDLHSDDVCPLSAIREKR